MESKTNNNYEVNDEELVYMVSENNDDAKDYLYQKYSGMIHSELNKVKKSAYALDIDISDLEQEALLGFSNAINTYDSDEETKFQTYATLCVRRKLINYIDKYRTTKNHVMKKAISIEKLSEEFGEDFVTFLTDNKRAPLDEIITHESLEEVIKKYGDKLSDSEKEALILSVDGKSNSEIAQIMEVPIKTVYNLLHRARNKLKQI